MGEIYDHREVVWLRTRATDSQIGEILKQRDEALARLAEYAGWSPDQFKELLAEYRELGEKHIELDQNRYDLEVALATTLAQLQSLRDAWVESWDCSRDPGHDIMNKAFEDIK